MATWKVVSETISSIDREKKIIIAECKKCKHIEEFMLKNSDELKGIKCKECLRTKEASGTEEEKVDKSNKHKIKSAFSLNKVDDNLRYRLKKIWLKLERDDKLSDEWKSFENFRDWSLANGYNYYKILERKNKNIPYRPSNCIWVENKTITQLEKVEDSLVFTVRVYTNILARTSIIEDNLYELDREINILNELSGIDKSELAKLLKSMNKIKSELEMIRKLEDTVWTGKNDVEGRGKTD